MQQGVHFYEKQEIADVIGGLEVPDDVLFFAWKRTPWCD